MAKERYEVCPSGGRPHIFLVRRDGREYVARGGKIQFTKEKAEEIASELNRINRE